MLLPSILFHMHTYGPAARSSAFHYPSFQIGESDGRSFAGAKCPLGLLRREMHSNGTRGNIA
eukprot:2587792-Pyramimonas_sp.AAC.1